MACSLWVFTVFWIVKAFLIFTNHFLNDWKPNNSSRWQQRDNSLTCDFQFFSWKLSFESLAGFCVLFARWWIGRAFSFLLFLKNFLVLWAWSQAHFVVLHEAWAFGRWSTPQKYFYWSIEAWAFRRWSSPQKHFYWSIVPVSFIVFAYAWILFLDRWLQKERKVETLLLTWSETVVDHFTPNFLSSVARFLQLTSYSFRRKISQPIGASSRIVAVQKDEKQRKHIFLFIFDSSGMRYFEQIDCGNWRLFSPFSHAQIRSIVFVFSKDFHTCIN